MMIIYRIDAVQTDVNKLLQTKPGYFVRNSWADDCIRQEQSRLAQVENPGGQSINIWS